MKQPSEDDHDPELAHYAIHPDIEFEGEFGYALVKMLRGGSTGRKLKRDFFKFAMACLLCGLPLFHVGGSLTQGLAALANGGATGAASIALQRHVGRIVNGPVQLRQAFSWLAIGPAFSNFVGPFTAGLLIDHAGFRTAFLALSVLALGTWACVRKSRELPPPEVPAGQGGTTAWSLLREPDFRRLMIINWLMSSCWDVHTFVVPVLGHERGLSASAIGAVLGAFAIAAMVVRILLPVVALVAINGASLNRDVAEKLRFLGNLLFIPMFFVYLGFQKDIQI